MTPSSPHFSAGQEPNDLANALARMGHQSDFPQIFFGHNKGSRGRERFKHEPDDGEVISLVLMAMEKLSP